MQAEPKQTPLLHNMLPHAQHTPYFFFLSFPPQTAAGAGACDNEPAALILFILAVKLITCTITRKAERVPSRGGSVLTAARALTCVIDLFIAA